MAFISKYCWSTQQYIYLIYPKLSMNFIPNLKYKTQLCHLWLRGEACDREYNCFFAHGQKDIRTIEQVLSSIDSRCESCYLYLSFNLESSRNGNEESYSEDVATSTIELQNSLLQILHTRPMQTRYFITHAGDHCTFAHSKKEKKRYQEAQNRQTGTQWMLEYQKYLAYTQFQPVSYYPENDNNIQRLNKPNYAENENLPDSRKLIKMHSYNLEERDGEKVERRTKSQESEEERVIEAALAIAKLDLVQKTEDSKTCE